MSPREPSSNGVVRSVDRAVSLLQLLAARGQARVSDLAVEVGVHKSTASRLLATLEARGLVEQDTDRGGYRLGHGAVQLAGSARGGTDLRALARPVCADLAEEVGETVTIAVRDHAWIICIDQVIGSASVSSVNFLGQRQPVHTTAAGKVLLAWLPATELDVLLAEPLARMTDASITDRDVLRAHLDVVRAQGWAETDGENEFGLNAVAAPVRAFDGAVVAALAVSGPSFRVTEARIPELAAQVVAAADALSDRNGHRRPV